MKAKSLFIFLFAGLMMTTVLSCGGEAESDDDPGGVLPRISVNNISLFEGDDNNTFDFRLRLTAASTQQVSVDYRTVNKSAIAGEDFVSTSGTLNFAPNEVEQLISVLMLTDTILEGDEEFELHLSNPVNATLSTTIITATVRNDDTFIPGSNDGYITPESYAGMTLVWRDEFDGTSIDASNWTHEMGGGGWGNNELQFYTDRSENSFVEAGKLVIQAKEEPFSGRDYTSARMISADKQEFTFGRVDIRAKLPKGQGIWPALWMLGGNIFEIGWPACGEIDIMELVGHEASKVHGTAHWGPQGSSTSQMAGNSYTISGADFSDEFHVFSIIWEQNKIRWFVDDQFYHEITTSSVGANDYPFNKEFFFIFNIAVGGNWPGSPDGSTVFPQKMFVDYIRMFQ